MSNHRDDQDNSGNFASPPCFMHEIDQTYSGLPPQPDAQQESDINNWRKAERKKLLASRRDISPADRQRFSEDIATGLDEVLGDVTGKTISVYWPIKCEPDLRGWMARVVERGGICALPLVVEPKTPLIFRTWQEGEKLERGFWNIPVPAEGKDVTPDILISPIVGFDPACYRLGYGGGYFDRTLAARAGNPLVVGVGYAQAALQTIFPQAHDIPMSMIVTEAGTLMPKPEKP